LKNEALARQLKRIISKLFYLFKGGELSNGNREIYFLNG